jgi:putative transposon-encoded protein
MAEKFEVSIEAERFIHNDLSNCAWGMRENMRKKIDADETDSIYFDMMGSLIFSAFAIEAQLNFVGWKVLGDGWPERANIREKINLLREVLKVEIVMGQATVANSCKVKTPARHLGSRKA